jgi:hypothetical protein
MRTNVLYKCENEWYYENVYSPINGAKAKERELYEHNQGKQSNPFP